MNIPKTLEDINNLISNQIEESLNLEYKSADALKNIENNKKEISKDVSSMANSSGGIIIYGIKEYDGQSEHLPEKITPIERKEVTKEWLEDVISSNIYPKIEDLKIHPVKLENENQVVYVVEIPQSTTAHQARDQRYYKRYNFKSQPMYDYEIRDVMNRSKHPVIDIEFYIQKQKILGEIPYCLPPTSIFEDYKRDREVRINYYLKFDLINLGSILANYVNIEIVLPKNILYDPEKKNYKDDECTKMVEKNTKRDIIGYDSKGFLTLGTVRYVPILPKLKETDYTITLCDSPKLDNRIINWTIYADNAPPKSGSIQLDQIKFEEVDRTEE